MDDIAREIHWNCRMAAFDKAAEAAIYGEPLDDYLLRIRFRPAHYLFGPHIQLVDALHCGYRLGQALREGYSA